MLTAAMLGLIEQIGLDVIVLTESLDDHEFFASRLTRMQTLQLLGSLAETARTLPTEVRALMPEVDWAAWDSLPGALAQPTRNSLRIWVAAKEWTPLTLLAACRTLESSAANRPRRPLFRRILAPWNNHAAANPAKNDLGGVDSRHRRPKSDRLQALSDCRRMHPALFRMTASDTGHGGHVAKVI